MKWFAGAKKNFLSFARFGRLKKVIEIESEYFNFSKKFIFNKQKIQTDLSCTSLSVSALLALMLTKKILGWSTSDCRLCYQRNVTLMHTYLELMGLKDAFQSSFYCIIDIWVESASASDSAWIILCFHSSCHNINHYHWQELHSWSASLMDCDLSCTYVIFRFSSVLLTTDKSLCTGQCHANPAFHLLTQTQKKIVGWKISYLLWTCMLCLSETAQ